MSPSIKLIVPLYLILLTITACIKEPIPPIDDDSLLNTAAFDGSPFAFIPINLTQYNLLPQSKSSTADQTSGFSVDSLLHWEQEEQLYLSGFKTLVRQIPIREMGKTYISLTKTLSKKTARDSVTFAKSYLIIVEDLSKGNTRQFVVTLCPEYHPANYHNNCTFLNKGGFSGIILYADKAGSLIGTEHYTSGRIEPIEMITKNNETQSGQIYLTIYQKIRNKCTESDDNKTRDGGELNACTVTASCPSPKPIKDPAEDNIEDERREDPEETTDHTRPPLGGGSGLTFFVSLNSSDPQKGSVSGAGTYAMGTPVSIASIPQWGCKFTTWKCDIGNITMQSFILETNINFRGTAYFQALIPCVDLLNNKANPLSHMKLAPPSGWNIRGATYGMTRTTKQGKSRMHNGIDLDAPIGSPIYSMFNGVVERVIDTQPNKIKEGKIMVYPPDYKGDDNDAGNRIHINSEINGDLINIGYWHLNAGSPIAVNPRTGRPFQSGDEVFQGDLIGYVGYTGSANQAVPHLHHFGTHSDPL